MTTFARMVHDLWDLDGATKLAPSDRERRAFLTAINLCENVRDFVATCGQFPWLRRWLQTEGADSCFIQAGTGGTGATYIQVRCPGEWAEWFAA